MNTTILKKKADVTTTSTDSNFINNPKILKTMVENVKNPENQVSSEEPVTTDSKMEIEMVEIEKIQTHPLYDEIYHGIKKNYDDLLQSMEDIPRILQPVLLTSDFRILSGDRRINAVREMGIKHIPAIILPDLDNDNQKKIILDANRFRKKSATEEILETQYYYSLNQRAAGRKSKKNAENPETIKGKTKDIVSKLVGYSATMIHSMYKVNLNNVEERNIIEKVDKEEISLSKALDMIKQLKKQKADGAIENEDSQPKETSSDSEINVPRIKQPNYFMEIKKEITKCDIKLMNGNDSVDLSDKLSEYICSITGTDIKIKSNQVYTFSNKGTNQPTYIVVKIDAEDRSTNSNNPKI